MADTDLPDFLCRQGQCSLVVVGSPLEQEVPRSLVYVLSTAAKFELFQEYIPFTTAKQGARTAALLDNLKRLYPDLVPRFKPKVNTVELMSFRLIATRDLSLQEKQSYIALSYRWRSAAPSGTTRLGEERNAPKAAAISYPLPVSPLMFKAVLNERQNDAEGVWVDQICINQDDEAEKDATIGLMDIIYKKARRVVIALDDVELSDEETSLFRLLIQHYESQTHEPGNIQLQLDGTIFATHHEPVLKNCCQRILRSEWFERAWCGHEMRLGQDLVFLVRCHQMAASTPQLVLRFAQTFFLQILSICSLDKQTTSRVTSLETFFQNRLDRSVKEHFGGILVNSITHLHQFSSDEVSPEVKEAAATAEASIRSGSSLHWVDTAHEIPEIKETYNSHSRVIVEVLESKAGGDANLPPVLRQSSANRDKISIVLNATETGLALNRLQAPIDEKIPLTHDEACRQLLIVALCDSDPEVLCMNGKQLPAAGGHTSWLCQPDAIFGGKYTCDLPRLPEKAQYVMGSGKGHEFIEIDLLFPCSIDGHRSQLYPATIEHLTESIKLYQNTLECYKERPEDWDEANRSNVELCGERSNVTFFETLRLGGINHFKQNFILYTKLLDCIFKCGLPWILASFEQENPSLESALTHLFHEDLTLRLDRLPLRGAALQHSAVIIGFIESLVLVHFNTSRDGEPVSAVTPAGDAFVTIVPSGIYELAVPIVLCADDYRNLARGWVLKSAMERGGRRVWLCETKTILLGNASFDGTRPGNWNIQRAQRVYGKQPATE